MENKLSILNAVRIKHKAIYLNQEEVFRSDESTDAFLSLAYKSLAINYPKFYKMDIMSKTGFIAAEILLKNNDIHQSDNFKLGMIFQNHAASLEADRKYNERLMEAASPALFVYTLPNIVMGEIAIRHGFKGENTFFVSDEFNATSFFEYVEILFDQQILDNAIIAYVECNTHEVDLLFCHVAKGNSNFLSIQSLNDLYNS